MYRAAAALAHPSASAPTESEIKEALTFIYSAASSSSSSPTPPPLSITEESDIDPVLAQALPFFQHRQSHSESVSHSSADSVPDLDFFFLFSSMNVMLGAHGQANYCAANSFIDSMARFMCGKGLVLVLVASWFSDNFTCHLLVLGARCSCYFHCSRLAW